MIISGIQDSVTTSKQTAGSAAANKTNFSKILSSTINNMDMNQIFEEASQKYGVPTKLLKAVAKVESNFNPDAKSSCGAMGVMQLMPKTASGLGVVNPYNAKENINGGAKLLSGLYKKYDGDLTLTLAAYNAGSGNVAKYGGVPPFKETQNYIKKVNAEIANSPGADIFGIAPLSQNTSNLKVNDEIAIQPSEASRKMVATDKVYSEDNYQANQAQLEIIQMMLLNMHYSQSIFSSDPLNESEDSDVASMSSASSEIRMMIDAIKDSSRSSFQRQIETAMLDNDSNK